MATFAHCSFPVSVETSKCCRNLLLTSSYSSMASSISSSSSLAESPSSMHFTSSPFPCQPRRLSVFSRFRSLGGKDQGIESNEFVEEKALVTAAPQESEATIAADAFSQFKHLLLPVTDRNPYLSEGTRQACATTAALAKKYGADITVVVIDENKKESLPEHETQLSSIRWHLSEGGFQEFRLLERLGEGSKPTAIIGEVADDLNLDLVVLSMEAIHSKYVDANLLAEFIPCPVMLLPL